VPQRTRTTRSALRCRLAALPRPLGLALVAVPAAAMTVGALGLTSATAAGTTTGTTLRLAAADGAGHADRAVRRPSPSEQRITAARLRAYFRAGYGYDDAVLLARLWSFGTTPEGAKLRAGADLLNGERPPIRPGQPARRVAAATAQEAFFANGYDYRDAVKLARLWHTRDIGSVKATAGRTILAGRRLPGLSPARARDKRYDAYFRAGYGYDDAVLLARLWGFGATPADAKQRAGDMLRTGEDVPIRPGDDAWDVGDDTARVAYFNAGYGYDDAVRLARTWRQDVGDSKATAGRKLLAGLPLPLPR
jgi:hypothetical protein